MKLIQTMFSIAAIAVVISGCKQVDFKKTKGGMPYKLFPSKSGAKAIKGGFLKVQMITKKNDSIIVNTYGSMPTYLPVPDEKSQYQTYDITEITNQLKQGDSVFFVQSIDTFMKRAPDRIPAYFKKGDKLNSSVKVIEVFPTEEAAQADFMKEQEKVSKVQLLKDDKTIADYLSKNNIKTEKLPGGTYVQITNPGSGDKVSDGKFVSLKYRGITFTGKVFDTNMDSSFHHIEPMEFVVGTQPLAKGFEEGLKALKQGDKARLFIPSPMAYGPQSPTPDIPPNSNLIFEIEVLKVADKSPTPNNPVPPIKDTTRR